MRSNQGLDAVGWVSVSVARQKRSPSNLLWVTEAIAIFEGRSTLGFGASTQPTFGG
ncbi:MAG: hypothetical protein WBA10_16555 [Elainellaceae cyanobacterium]